MTHNAPKNKFYVQPTDRLDLLFALTKAQAKEQAKGKKHKKLLEQVDLLVMVALIGHRNNQTGQCDPSHATIARAIGVSVSTVKRSFKRLVAAGFVTTSARSFKGLQTSSQVNIDFRKGDPWLAHSRSHMTERSVSDDLTLAHGCVPRSITDDPAGRSLMTNERSEENSEKEPSEKNSDAPREPAVALDTQVGEPKPQAGNDNRLPANWATDWRDQFWDCSPERKNVAATEQALIAIAKSGVNFESILIAARRRCKTEKPGYHRDPVKWLADKPWLDNAKAAALAAKVRNADRPKGFAI